MATQNLVKGYIGGLRCKNFQINTINGSVDTTLTLSGFAKTFLGLVIVQGTAPAGTFVNLIINNDVVIDDGLIDFFEVDPSNPRQYYDFVRPLTGQDTITLRTESTAAGIMDVLVYYQNNAAV
jgi:hypothetical protein